MLWWFKMYKYYVGVESEPDRTGNTKWSKDHGPFDTIDKALAIDGVDSNSIIWGDELLEGDTDVGIMKIFYEWDLTRNKWVPV
jgi:hypothetical protein